MRIGEEDDKATFDIHQHSIAFRSAFFKKAITGDWKEAQDRVVKLPEDELTTFQHYVHLLYTGKLGVVPESGPAPYDGGEEKIRLAKLYVLAEKLQDVDTKNLVETLCYSAVARQALVELLSPQASRSSPSSTLERLQARQCAE